MLTRLLTTGINAVTRGASVALAVNSGINIASQPRKRYDLHYPLSLTGINQLDDTDNSLELIRPTIVFTCNSRFAEGPAVKIAFPIPQGLEFSDGASYDDNTLGILGSGIIDTAKSAIATANSGGNVADVISNSIDSLKKNFVPTSIESGLFTAANAIGGMSDTFKSSLGIAMKMTVNRHVTTEFTGIGTRNYGFKFKMIGSSRQESDMIRDICETFRDGLYPDGDALALRYPPTWTIRFMLKNSDIEYIPKIWECYLTSVNVSYNGTAALWHDDGSPIECDITVSFKETRALTHKDIQELKKQPFTNIQNTNSRNVAQRVDSQSSKPEKVLNRQERRADRKQRGI